MGSRGIRATTETGIVADLVRTQRRHAVSPSSGGFDPNEDPVIIGSTATSNTTGTPDNPTAGSSGAVVIGLGAIASAGKQVVIGDAAGTSSGTGHVAIGWGAIANGADFGIAIGRGALAEDGYSTAIGHVAHAKLSGIAIGENAKAPTVAFHDNAIAIGNDALAPFAGDISIGYNAETSSGSTYGNDAIAIGHSAVVGGVGLDGSQSVGIGYGATVAAPNSVGIGEGVNVTDYSAVAIGSDSSVSAHEGVAIGRLATASGTQSTAIGRSADASYNNSTAIGQGSSTDRTGQVMLGKSTQVVDVPNIFAMYDQNDGLRYEVSLVSGAFVFTQVS